MAEDFEGGPEPRDYTKWVWGGIALAAVAVLIALSMSGREHTMSTQASVKHILVAFDMADPASRLRALDQINDIRERLLKGEDFAKLAEEYSDDPQSAARGGYLGWADKGAYDKPFDEYVWSAPIGEISPVIQSQFGYHIIVVLERRLSEADAYDRKLEEEVKQQGPAIEIPKIEGLPQATPAPAQ